MTTRSPGDLGGDPDGADTEASIVPLASPRLTTPRATRRSRGLDRETTLRMVAEDLAETAAMVEGRRRDRASRQLSASRVHVLPPALALLPDVQDEDTDRLVSARLGLDDVAEVELSGHGHAAPATRGTTSLPTPQPAATPVAPARAGTGQATSSDAALALHLEQALAQVEVLTARCASEAADRAALERRLAAAQDELRFLRAELQMVGQRRRSRNPLRRLLAALPGRRRPVVPATPPKRRR